MYITQGYTPWHVHVDTWSLKLRAGCIRVVIVTKCFALFRRMVKFLSFSAWVPGVSMCMRIWMCMYGCVLYTCIFDFQSEILVIFCWKFELLICIYACYVCMRIMDTQTYIFLSLSARYCLSICTCVCVYACFFFAYKQTHTHTYI